MQPTSKVYMIYPIAFLQDLTDYLIWNEKMKKVGIFYFLFIMMQTPCFAKDYIVEFVNENYQETQASSYPPIIYHSIQVRTQAGPKLLVLKGDNRNYRKLLREYIAENKAFIAKVPEDENELFIASKAFEIDVSNLHPLNLSKYNAGEEKTKNRINQLELKKLQSRDVNKKNSEQQPLKKEDTIQAQKSDELKKEENVIKSKQLMEQEKQIQALKQQQEEEELKLQQGLEEQRKNQQALLTQQRAEDEKRRRDEFNQRWQELKKRLIENDTLRKLSQEARNREIKRRWLELKARYQL